MDFGSGGCLDCLTQATSGDHEACGEEALTCSDAVSSAMINDKGDFQANTRGKLRTFHACGTYVGEARLMRKLMARVEIPRPTRPVERVFSQKYHDNPTLPLHADRLLLLCPRRLLRRQYPSCGLRRWVTISGAFDGFVDCITGLVNVPDSIMKDTPLVWFILREGWVLKRGNSAPFHASAAPRRSSPNPFALSLARTLTPSPQHLIGLRCLDAIKTDMTTKH